jgi:hypothetical protein
LTGVWKKVVTATVEALTVVEVAAFDLDAKIHLDARCSRRQQP